jgi:hypothetical protein
VVSHRISPSRGGPGCLSVPGKGVPSRHMGRGAGRGGGPIRSRRFIVGALSIRRHVGHRSCPARAGGRIERTAARHRYRIGALALSNRIPATRRARIRCTVCACPRCKQWRAHPRAGP